MAITALKSSPARKLAPNSIPRLQRLPDPVLRLVAELRPSEGKSVTKVAFNSIIFGAMIFTLIAVMGLNLALNQDAIKLHRLKFEAIHLADLEEANSQNLARVSSPESLAKKAQLLGMVPSGTPDFLILNKPKVTEVIVKDKGMKE
jgi:hypothetical protein